MAETEEISARDASGDPLWNLAEDKASIGLIEAFLAADKAVALVCHAPGVLRTSRAAMP